MITLFAFLCFVTVVKSQSNYNYDPASPQGPAGWINVDVEDNQCGGQKNSPIAVTSIDCTKEENYAFTNGDCKYTDLKYTISDIGVKAEFPETCSRPQVNIPGINETYTALQFHIHTSSEHTIDGRFFGAEMHIVHANTNQTRFAVVGMMIEPTSPTNNEQFSGLVEGWQVVQSEKDTACGDVCTQEIAEARNAGSRKLQPQTALNIYDFVEGAYFYFYDGGLTTPPCSEVVWWNLADRPVSISVLQFNALVGFILNYRDDSCKLATVASPSGSTSRPVQELNGRTVDKICPAGEDSGGGDDTGGSGGGSDTGGSGGGSDTGGSGGGSDTGGSGGGSDTGGSGGGSDTGGSGGGSDTGGSGGDSTTDRDTSGAVIESTAGALAFALLTAYGIVA